MFGIWKTLTHQSPEEYDVKKHKKKRSKVDRVALLFPFSPVMCKMFEVPC
jgi:hypothetical protein